MAAFELQRTGFPDLLFEGTLLVEQLGLTDDPRTENRHHDIGVYESNDGDLIVSIRFYSSHAEESCDNFVDVVENQSQQPSDRLEVVEEILSLYQPEICFASTPKNRNTDEDARITREMTRRYDLQVHAVLQALAEVTAAKLKVADA